MQYAVLRALRETVFENVDSCVAIDHNQVESYVLAGGAMVGQVNFGGRQEARGLLGRKRISGGRKCSSQFNLGKDDKRALAKYQVNFTGLAAPAGGNQIGTFGKVGAGGGVFGGEAILKIAPAHFPNSNARA